MGFKTKSLTLQIGGVRFTANNLTFNGSKVDKQFSYSKIDFALRQNAREEQQQSPNAQVQSSKHEFTPTNSGDFSTGIGGLFSDLLTQNPTNDPEEDEFRRRMQRKKRKGIRR